MAARRMGNPPIRRAFFFGICVRARASVACRIPFYMPPVPRRVVIAFALSIFLHGVIFSVMALTSALGPAKSAVEEKDEPTADEPLEVVIRAAPRLAPDLPEPEEQLVVRVKEEEAVMKMEAVVERTQLDPESLKKSETAPENPEFLAAHHSQAGKRKTASPPPQPTPVPNLKPGQPLFRTADSAPPEPSPAPELPEPEGGEGEEGGVAAIGAWRKAIANAVGSRWERFRQSKMGLLAVGSVRMKFAIDAKGRVSDIRVHSNTAGPENAEYATRSIAEAEIPPIPPERLARLPGGRVEVEFTFTIYPAH